MGFSILQVALQVAVIVNVIVIINVSAHSRCQRQPIYKLPVYKNPWNKCSFRY